MTLAAKSTATEYAACYYLTHAQFVATTEFGYIIIIFIIRKICQCPYYSQEHRCMTLYMWKPVLRILSEFAASHNSTDLQSADEVDVMVYLQTTSYRIGTGYEAQWPLCTFFIIKHSLYLIVEWTRSQCSSCRWGVCVCNVECRRWAMQRRSALSKVAAVSTEEGLPTLSCSSPVLTWWPPVPDISLPTASVIY